MEKFNAECVPRKMMTASRVNTPKQILKLPVAPESGLDMKKLSVSWKLPVDRLAP
jgi:hypothetical protein